jgi:predicted Zn-dependent protease
MLSDWPASLKLGDQFKLTGAASLFLECVADSCSPSGLHQLLPHPEATPNASPEALYREQRWENLTRLPSSANTRNEAFFEKGVAWAELGECEKAIPYLERSIGPKNSSASTLFHLSQCYAGQANLIAAELSKSGKDQAIVHLMRGDVLLRLQADSKAAVTEYLAAVSARPDDPAGWERLGEAQLAAGSSDEARSSAQKALKLDPHRLPAMRTMAQAAMQEREYSEALPYLRELATLNPRDLTTRVQLATACSQTGALQEALTNLDSALKQGYPDEKGSLHYQLGTILRGLGRTVESTQAFAEAKALSDRFQNTSLRDKGSKE